MKKLLCVLLAVMAVLALAACGDKTPQQNGGQQDQPAQSVDLKKAAEDAIASIGNEDIVLMPEEDTDSIEAQYPGLTAVETKQLVVYWPPVVGFGCELVMVEVTNGADAETVRGILQQRVDNANASLYHGEGLIINETPDDDGLEQCRQFGAGFAGF